MRIADGTSGEMRCGRKAQPIAIESVESRTAPHPVPLPIRWEEGGLAVGYGVIRRAPSLLALLVLVGGRDVLPAGDFVPSLGIGALAFDASASALIPVQNH